jgi:predicted transcriptional regulator
MTDLEKAAREFHTAKAALDAARDRLAIAIVAAASSGTRQSEIVNTTGYTRETVRRICRDAGAPAAVE